MPARTTRYVRVKVDLILHYEEEFSGLPCHELVDGTCLAVTKLMVKDAQKRGTLVPIGFSDGHLRYALHFPSKRVLARQAAARAAEAAAHEAATREAAAKRAAKKPRKR